MKTKICSKCNCKLPISEFYKDKKSKDGFRDRCISCWKLMNKKYYTNNTNKCKNKSKQYRNNNKDKISKYYSNYQKKNRDNIRKYQRDYFRTPKGKLIQKKSRLKRSKGIIHNISDKEFIYKLNSTNGNCQMCGKYVGINNLTIDHIIPISSVDIGAIYNIEDIQFLCRSCNSKKGDRILNYYNLNNWFGDIGYQTYLKKSKELLNIQKTNKKC
jgi:5-methylcytosine-specific restriction endonuclease McrA